MRLLGAFLHTDGTAHVVHCADDDEEEQWARPLSALTPEEVAEVEGSLTRPQWYMLTGELTSFLENSKCMARNQHLLLLQAFAAVKDTGGGLERVLQGCLAASVELTDQILLRLLTLTAQAATPASPGAASPLGEGQ
jgi:hypothetical protein